MSEANDPKRPRVRPALFGAVGFLVIGVVIWVFAVRIGKDPSLGYSELHVRTAPSLDLPYLAAEGTLNLDDLRGQIVVVNFWASWCDPCEDEHADLLATAAAYRDRGVVFLGILRNDTEQAAVDYLDLRGWGEGYLHVVDVNSRASIEFGVFGQPETYFVDADGVIVEKVAGPSTRESLQAQLDAMLAAGASG